MVDQSFPKRNRLKTEEDFQRVYEEGKKQVNNYFVIYGRENDRGIPRIGLVTSRSLGKAVERNRVKRMLREAFRKNKSLFDFYDIVVIPREKVTSLNNKNIEREFLNTIQRMTSSNQEG